MIHVIAERAFASAARLVEAALSRSVGAGQVRALAPGAISSVMPQIVVAISPSAYLASILDQYLSRENCKLLLLGSVPDSLANSLGFYSTPWPADLKEASRSAPAPSFGEAFSRAQVRYLARQAPCALAGWLRAFERFDFTDEWNNLGYGAIRADGSIWALAAPLRASADTELAAVEIQGQCVASYCALKDSSDSSVLWFNRAVGPIDSFEWYLVECFLSSWRHDVLPCQPVFEEVPWGCESIVTMRLDCDEDIESARRLRARYHEEGVPFSLAIHTTNLSEARHHPILREMADAGESILSHTATHAPDWGGSYEAAYIEARDSALALERVTGRSPRYAVSPFHQSPDYALEALVDCGYEGCIGGIIRNDPEFLLARGGPLAGLPDGFIGHSQQTMLHGDCMLEEGDPLRIYKQAFDRALETRTLFGYLDHPFSQRYQYGWSDEAQRIEAHVALLTHIRRVAPKTLFLSEEAALDFLMARSGWNAIDHDAQFEITMSAVASASALRPTICYAGKRFEATLGTIEA